MRGINSEIFAIVQYSKWFMCLQWFFVEVVQMTDQPKFRQPNIRQINYIICSDNFWEDFFNEHFLVIGTYVKWIIESNDFIHKK